MGQLVVTRTANLLRKIAWKIAAYLPHRISGALHLILTPKVGLEELGWFRSRKSQSVVDAEGRPLPWMTYPFLQFITPRVSKHWIVFEYGMGNSTLWWSERVASVHSVEHDLTWFQSICARIPNNVDARFFPERSHEYVSAPQFAGKKYNVICIDGRRRNESVVHSINCLTEDGVIVWDNTERHRYEEGIAKLLSFGFKKIDFWGMSPTITNNSCTSIFYRPRNCFNI